MRYAFFILLIANGATCADVTLEWTFKPGDSFVTERVYRQEQEIEVKGKSFKQDTTNTWLVRVNVLEKRGGNWALGLKVEDATYKTTGVGNPAVFDDKLAARMKGAGLGLVVTPYGEVKKLSGYGDFVKKLADGKEDTEKVLRTLFSEEGLQETFEEIFAFLPRKSVDKGERWKREALDPAPPFGSFKTRFDYVYRGVQEDLHAIEYTMQTAYQKPSDPPALFRVVKGSLSGEEGKGLYLFDAEAGRLVRGEKTMLVRGQVTIEASGAESTLKFSSKNRLKVRVVK
jgi:hypothetical protein